MKKITKVAALSALLVGAVTILGGLTGEKEAMAKGGTAAKQVTKVGTDSSLKPGLVKHQELAPMKFFFGGPMGNTLSSPIHQENYLTYLVKDYAPATLAQWQQAFQEREKVMAELEQNMPAKKDFVVGGHLPVNIPVVDSEEVPGGKLAVPDVKGNFLIKLQGEAKDAKLGKQMIVKSFSGDGEMVKALQPNEEAIKELEKSMELNQQFADAVKSQNKDAIAALLPKLLDQYKKETAKMIKISEEMKKVVESAGKSK